MALVHVDSRISQRATNIDIFYGHFLEYFTSDGESKDIQNKLTWLQRLPQLATDGSYRALVLALEATATAYGAIMSSNTALTQQARNLYGTALHIHHRMLQTFGSRDDYTIHMVSTSVLLSFFEAMHATTADAYRSHINGAAKMIEVTGPGNCMHGILCQLFYHIRTQMVFVQLASGDKEISISAKNILHEILLYKDLPTIQKLMCCIAKLGDLYAKRCKTQEQDLEALEILKTQITQLWNEYSRNLVTLTKRNDSNNASAGNPLICNAFSALTIAYFSSAHILLTMFDFDGDCSANMTHCPQHILEAATYLDTAHNAFAYMRMATPLLIVALHAQRCEHRKKAIDMFELWLRGSMRGISALALDAVHRQERKYAGMRGSDRVPRLPASP